MKQLQMREQLVELQSEVCIAPLHVGSKFDAPLDGSNADFVSHMEWGSTDFAPHMERRHSFMDQKCSE